MNRSGIIYPDPQDIAPVSVAGVDNLGGQIFATNVNRVDEVVDETDSVYPVSDDFQFDQVGLRKTVADADMEDTNSEKDGTDTDFGSGRDVISEINNISNYKTALHETSKNTDINISINLPKDHGRDSHPEVVSVDKNLDEVFRLHSNTTRKFSSAVNSDSGDIDKSRNGNNTNELLTIRQIATRKNDGNSGISEDKHDGSGNGQSNRVTGRMAGLRTRTRTIKEKVKSVASNKRRGGRLSKDNSKTSKTKEKTDRRDDKDSPLLNLMFVFEIFRWFTGSDIIVRFIIGAIAGVVGFGFIFTSMGLLSNL